MNSKNIKSFKIDNIVPYKEIPDGQISLFLYISEIGNDGNQFVIKNPYDEKYFYINRIDLKVKKDLNKAFNDYFDTIINQGNPNPFCPLCGKLLIQKSNGVSISSYCVNLYCIDIKNYRNAVYDKLKIINTNLDDNFINIIINCLNDINFSSNKFLFNLPQLIRKIKAECELNYVSDNNTKIMLFNFLNDIANISLFQFFKMVGIADGCEEDVLDFCNILDNDFYKFSTMVDYFISDSNNNILNSNIADYVKLVSYINRDTILFLKEFKEGIK